MTVTNDESTSTMWIRFQSRNYSAAEVSRLFEAIRDLAMVLTLTDDEKGLLALSTDPQRSDSQEALLRDVTQTPTLPRRNTEGGQAVANYVADVISLRDYRRRVSPNAVVNGLRRQYGQDLEVRSIKMDSPMEVLLFLSGPLTIASFRLWDKWHGARATLAKANADVARYDAEVATARVQKALAEIVEQELRDEGLSSAVLKAKSMQTVIANISSVTSRVDKLQLEP